MSKNIARQISAFAINPASRDLLLNDDTMMKSLVQFLAPEGDSETIIAALEGFEAFLGNAAHCSKISQLPNIMNHLVALMEWEADADKAVNTKVNNLAKKVHDGLSKSAEGSEASAAAKRAVRGAYAVRGYIHQMSLSVPELKDDSQRALIETTLIGIKGLVSVVIDVNKKTINLGATVKPSEFQPICIAALAEAGIHAEVPKEPAKPTYINRNATKDALVRYTEAKPEKPKSSGGWLSGITSYFW